MPAKNVEKIYVVDGIYHAYNRGVEKRKIFLDDQDYEVFLHLLKYYLSPTYKTSPHPINTTGKIKLIRPRPLKNLNQEVELIAYCLMPNHYHLLLKQTTIDGMTKLLRRVATTYSLYFNRRHKRVGYLFQGRYKATQVEDQASLLHLSRYIHLNPYKYVTRSHLVSYKYFSYPYFLRLKTADWLHPEIVLSLIKNYKDFVEQSPDTQDPIIFSLKIDEEAR
jgi:putative transposase